MFKIKKALKSDDLVMLERLITAKPKLIHSRSWLNRNTPLHITVCYDIKAVEHLLSKGAEINARNAAKETPLHIAAARYKTEILELLLSRGADVNARNKKDETPFAINDSYFEADRNRKKRPILPILSTLLAHGANINNQDKEGRTPLIWASIYPHSEQLAVWLIDKGAELDNRDNAGYTALHYAAEFARFHIVKALLEKGANGKLKVTHGQFVNYTPMNLAKMRSSPADHRYEEVIKLLRQAAKSAK